MVKQTVNCAMGNPTFSIIIPHYNIPDLLMRCLDSIPVSDDIQVIVVDDCSPGAENYTSKYPQLSRNNLELYSTGANGGAGKARNVGLEHARGRWLIFADADDFFTPALTDLMDKYRDSEADIVYFCHDNVLSNDITIKAQRVDFYNEYIVDYLNSGNDINLRFKHVTPWGKLFKTQLIRNNNIQFDEIPYGNDVIFTITAACKANVIKAYDEVVYVLTEREGSLTHNLNRKPKELKIRSEVALRTYKIIKENDFNIGFEYDWDFKLYFKILYASKEYATICKYYHDIEGYGIRKSELWRFLTTIKGGIKKWPFCIYLLIDDLVRK